MGSRIDADVFERKVRPIYDALDARNWKVWDTFCTKHISTSATVIALHPAQFDHQHKISYNSGRPEALRYHAGQVQRQCSSADFEGDLFGQDRQALGGDAGMHDLTLQHNFESKYFVASSNSLK